MFSFSVQLFYMILANEKYLFLQIYFFHQVQFISLN